MRDAVNKLFQSEVGVVGNYFNDNSDLQFYFEHGIDWEPLVELVEHGWQARDGFKNVEEAQQFYREILSMVGSLVADEIAPRIPEIDRTGPRFENGQVIAPKAFDEIFDQFKELEMYGMCMPRELGGMGCPLAVNLFVLEMLARADVSILTHYGFFGAIALSMLLYSIEEGTTSFDRDAHQYSDTRWRKEIAEVIAGDAWGAMDITEPNAGSDMAAIATRAEQDKAGNWYLTGEKIFITSGHGKYHFVIARTGEASSGLRGLSLFLVPTYETDADGNVRRLATVERLEEKLGHHGSATCTLQFDHSPAQLVGQVGDGFKHMLLLMNGARVSVGFEALGLCEAAFRMAKEYAAERKSMGKSLDQHEIIADYLDEMETDIYGLRALAFDCGFHDEMARRCKMAAEFRFDSDSLAAKQLQKRARQHARRARRGTPLLKYLGAEKAVAMARQNMQIHGGVGYTTEYGAEKLLRDSLVIPIYEGTSQIQALMAMKDCLGEIIKNPQRFVRRLAQARWRSVSARDPLEKKLAKLQSLALAAQQHLIQKTATGKLKALGQLPLNEWPQSIRKNWDPKRDFAFAALHAERLTKMLADVAICEVLFKQVTEHPDRRNLLERYLERATPRCHFLHEEITTTGERLVRKLGSAEADGEHPVKSA